MKTSSRASLIETTAQASRKTRTPMRIVRTAIVVSTALRRVVMELRPLTPLVVSSDGTIDTAASIEPTADKGLCDDRWAG